MILIKIEIMGYALLSYFIARVKLSQRISADFTVDIPIVSLRI